MQHSHDGFRPKVVRCKEPWIRPSLTCVQLTPAELKEAGTSPESVHAFGLKLKAQGRL
jgi:hypothetical protein